MDILTPDNKSIRGHLLDFRDKLTRFQAIGDQFLSEFEVNPPTANFTKRVHTGITEVIKEVHEILNENDELFLDVIDEQSGEILDFQCESYYQLVKDLEEHVHQNYAHTLPRNGEATYEYRPIIQSEHKMEPIIVGESIPVVAINYDTQREQHGTY